VNGRIQVLGHFLAVSLALGSLVIGGCGSDKEVIIRTADGVELGPADIDRDPLALLPPNAVGWVYTDARAQLSSAFGQRLLQILQSRLPVPPSAGFVPERDLERTYLGLYSMQGVDFAGVAIGTFDPAAIDQAASGVADTPLGGPLKKSEYAGRRLYTAANVGFVVLTTRTALFGNETGIRRAFDRIDRGQLGTRLPPWAEESLSSPNAHFAMALDLTGQAPVAAATERMPFLERLGRARASGNFASPGMQLSMLLSYPDADAASRGANRIMTLQQQLASLSFFTALIGMGDPIVGLNAVPQGTDVQVGLGLNTSAVGQLIEQLASALGAPPGPVQAQSGPLAQ
jgi:hypothetical protein